MTHLTDQLLLELAQKVLAEAPFDDGDIEGMKHIAHCQACYEMLCCTMAVQDVSRHLGDFPAEPNAAQKARAVIRLVASALRPLLDQVDATLSGWTFDRPLLLAGARSSGEDAASLQMLEDNGNERTFVAYDPATRQLVIQLDGEDFQEPPKVFLRTPNGVLREVPLSASNGLLRARVPDLPEGEYEIILEK